MRHFGNQHCRLIDIWDHFRPLFVDYIDFETCDKAKILRDG